MEKMFVCWAALRSFLYSVAGSQGKGLERVIDKVVFTKKTVSPRHRQARSQTQGPSRQLMSDEEHRGAAPAPFDPFADADGDDQVVTKGIVHIRLQQRNGRKSLTTIQGLDDKLDLAKLTKAFKKEFCCNGCVVDNKELGKVIQLQGDQREKVKSFLSDEDIASKKMIKVHGI